MKIASSTRKGFDSLPRFLVCLFFDMLPHLSSKQSLRFVIIIPPLQSRNRSGQLPLPSLYVPSPYASFTASLIRTILLWDQPKSSWLDLLPLSLGLTQHYFMVLFWNIPNLGVCFLHWGASISRVTLFCSCLIFFME